MPVRPFRFATPFLMALAIGGLSLPALAASPVPLGIDLGGSGPVTPMPAAVAARPPAPATAPHAGIEMAHAGMEMAHEGQNDVRATGVINSIDQATHKVNITHQPIPAIGWPSMTMDFAIAPTVNLAGLKPSARINFSMIRQPDGMYAIQSIVSAGGSP